MSHQFPPPPPPPPQVPPAPPPPPQKPPVRQASTVAVVVVAVLCAVALAAAVAAGVSLLRDSGDSELTTESPSTTQGTTSTRVETTAQTTIATTTVVPTTVAAAALTYGTTPCPPAAGAAAPVRSFPSPFQKCIDVTKKYTALVNMNKGVLSIELDAALAPVAVNNFVSLARARYFDGTPCHRIIPSFVVQCGDPTGTGTGGPGYKFADELPKAGQYKVGSLVMANSGVNTNGSQFFIISGAQGVALPPSYSLFGQVTVGLTTTLKALDLVGTASGTPKEAISITTVRITEL